MSDDGREGDRPATGRTVEEYGGFAEVVLETMRQPLIVVDGRHCIQVANRAFRRRFGLDPAQLAGRPIYATAGGAWDVPRLRELLEEILPRDRKVDDFELELEVPPFGERVLQVNARRLEADHGLMVLAMEDVTERLAFEARLGSQSAGRAAATLLLQEIAVLANNAEGFEEALHAAVETICRIDGWQLGHAYVAVEREGHRVFVDTGHWYLQDEARFAAFRDAFVRGAVAEHEDAVGRAASRGEVVQVRDLEASETFRYKRAARETGLSTAILVPVRVRERVVAVLELFSSSPRDLDHETAAVMAEVGIQLGRVAERREMERQIAEFTEHTQARFAQHLHDGVAQGLVGLIMTARRMREEASPAQHGRADRLIEGLEEAAGQVRSLSRALLPVDVEAEDLAEAIDTLVRRFRALGAMQCRFESGSHLPLHDSVVATHLFRIVQEALQNAVEHSGAGTVTVRVHDGDRLVVEVEDDGHGFDDRKALGVGQRIMQHRAATIGARLTVESSAEGTRVRCELEPHTAEGYARGR